MAVTAPHSEAHDLQGFDVAIDAVGGDVPEWIYASVRPGGQLVVLQEPPRQELAALIAAGQVEVAVAQTFPLSAGRAAYESGSLPKPAPDKTVIIVP